MDNTSGILALIQYLVEHWGEITVQFLLLVKAFFALLGFLVTICSFITPFTKTPKDDEFLAKVKNWIHQFSFTNAKNVKGIGQDDQVKK